MNKLRWMQIFVAVAESGSFSEAAKRLDISSVMVGKAVAQLEAHLQVRLLQRNTRRQTLTEAGRAWYDESRQVLAAVHLAESRIESIRRAPVGSLRISAAYTLGNCIVAKLCGEFQNRYPDITLELELSDRFVDVIAEEFDFVFRVGNLPENMPLVAQRLGNYEMVIAGAPAYLARYGIPQSLADLSAHRCLRNSIWNKRNAWWSEEDDAFWSQNVTFSCNDGHALKQAAVAGAGLVLQPRILLADEIAAGRLVTVLEHVMPQPRPVNLLWRQDLHAVARHKTFQEWVKSRGQALLGFKEPAG